LTLYDIKVTETINLEAIVHARLEYARDGELVYAPTANFCISSAIER
jgi:hypothetical protein